MSKCKGEIIKGKITWLYNGKIRVKNTLFHLLYSLCKEIITTRKYLASSLHFVGIEWIEEF